ncbi:MAG: carbamate kinase [Proteobacteria bacterium]|nr:carbamate kinase [Pseudomonadota bacterium]
MLIVVALGGNALLRRGESPAAATQRANLRRAAAALAPLADAHQLVVTHGNGPQVGLLALQSAAAHGPTAYPLDVLGAESDGQIGYMIEQELSNCLPRRAIATLLTQVEVDPADPAFAAPTKPIGPGYDAATAGRLAAEHGWTVAADGARFRRVVASPEPRRILELATVRLLIQAGIIVVCLGGGGIPVATTPGGAICGIEAVIDKDLAAALLARELAADALLLLTDVEAVFADWPQPACRPIRQASVRELRARAFAPGSMAPKVEAACRFAEASGRPAFIGALDAAAAVLAGRAGTRIDRGAAA